DRAIDADHSLALLVDDGVQNDRGLSGLTVADDQLALAAADRNHRVDRLDAGLQRLAHRLAIEDAGSNALQRIALRRGDGTLIVDRFSERVDYPADQRFAHWHRHDGIGALDGVAFFNLGVFAKQHGADFVLFQVQRDAENAVGKREHFASHDFFQAVNARNSVTDTDDRADFVDGDSLFVIINLLAQNLADFV